MIIFFLFSVTVDIFIVGMVLILRFDKLLVMPAAQSDIRLHAQNRLDAGLDRFFIKFD